MCFLYGLLCLAIIINSYIFFHVYMFLLLYNRKKADTPYLENVFSSRSVMFDWMKAFTVSYVIGQAVNNLRHLTSCTLD